MSKDLGYHRRNSNEHGAFNGGIIRGGPRSKWKNRVWNNTPSWVLNDAKVRLLLTKVFPRLQTNQVQRERAGRWLQVINLYWRVGEPASRVAAALGLCDNELTARPVPAEKRRCVKVVEDTVIRINRAWKGVRTTGRARTTGKPGRPRKLAPSNGRNG